MDNSFTNKSDLHTPFFFLFSPATTTFIPWSAHPHRHQPPSSSAVFATGQPHPSQSPVFTTTAGSFSSAPEPAVDHRPLT
ncbi:hypothetical protein Hanom_Chr03g00227801 [Helianthus anomalus]